MQLDVNYIQSHFNAGDISIEVLEEISSTNDYLKVKKNFPGKITACFAEKQTAGRGQLGRAWHSPESVNIYLSVDYIFKKRLQEINGLSSTLALAVCRAIASSVDLNEHKLSVKWPNDVFFDAKKLAGILVEVESISQSMHRLIIGVGINVNMSNASEEEIDQPWISLGQITQKYIDRNRLGVSLIKNILSYLDRFSQCGWVDFIQEWGERDSWCGKQVLLSYDNKQIIGTYDGVNEHGQIKILTTSGELQEFFSGDLNLI